MSKKRTKLWSTFLRVGMVAPTGSPPTSNQSTQAVITLIAGVSAWTFLPFLGAIIGIIVGRNELRAIQDGRSAEEGKTITMIGYYLSIANLVSSLVAGCFAAAFFMGGLALLGIAA